MLGQDPAAAMALADERRSATADVLSAADENARKSKPNGRKTNAEFIAICALTLSPCVLAVVAPVQYRG
jgi:hypothetical protein